MHGGRMHDKGMAWSTRPRITPQTQIFSYGRSIFVCHIRPKFFIFLWFMPSLGVRSLWPHVCTDHMIKYTFESRSYNVAICHIHSSPPVLKLGHLCSALQNFSSVIPKAWIINRGWSLNTSNTWILLVFNHHPSSIRISKITNQSSWYF